MHRKDVSTIYRVPAGLSNIKLCGDSWTPSIEMRSERQGPNRLYQLTSSGCNGVPKRAFLFPYYKKAELVLRAEPAVGLAGSKMIEAAGA